MVENPSGTQDVTPAPLLKSDPVAGKVSANEQNPFLVEDSSDLEGKPVLVPMLAPLPDPVSVPVGAQPSENGNK